MKNKQGLTPSEAAALLGSIKTPKKAASSARNVAATQFKRKSLTEIECTCGLCPDVDSPEAKAGKSDCPRAKVIRMRRWREKQAAEHAITLPLDGEGD